MKYIRKHITLLFCLLSIFKLLFAFIIAIQIPFLDVFCNSLLPGYI